MFPLYTSNLTERMIYLNWINAGKDGSIYELYANMENKYGSGHTRITIGGKITASSKCKGFCRYKCHPGFLTEQDMCIHQCTAKDCRFLLPKPIRINTIRRQR